MNSVQCCACLKRCHIVGPDVTQFPICGNHSALTAAGKSGVVPHSVTAPSIANDSHIPKEDKRRRAAGQ